MTIRPIKVDLTIYKGAAFDEVFEVVEDDGTTAVNLTGSSIQFKVLATFDATTALVDLTTSNGGITYPYNGSNNKFRLYMSSTNTVALSAIENAVHSLRIVPSSGAADAYYIATGTVDIPEVVIQ